MLDIPPLEIFIKTIKIFILTIEIFIKTINLRLNKLTALKHFDVRYGNVIRDGQFNFDSGQNLSNYEKANDFQTPLSVVTSKLYD